MSIEILYLARQLVGFHAPRGLVYRWDIFAHFFKRLCSSYVMHLALHMGFPVGSMTICILWSWRDWMTRLMVIAENNSITQVASPPLHFPFCPLLSHGPLHHHFQSLCWHVIGCMSVCSMCLRGPYWMVLFRLSEPQYPIQWHEAHYNVKRHFVYNPIMYLDPDSI